MRLGMGGTKRCVIDGLIAGSTLAAVKVISNLREVTISVTAMFLLHGSAQAAGMALPRSTPEAQGISSKAILDFVEAADKNINTLHSFMIVRHGRVIAEGWWKPEAADKPHVLASLSKCFKSVGML